MASSSSRAGSERLLLAIKVTSFLTLGPILAVGHIGLDVVGGFFGCLFPVPFVLCQICPAPCTFSLIRPWLFGGILTTGLLAGRVFCGLLCPFGVVSGILFSASPRQLFVGSSGKLTYLRYGAMILFLYVMAEAASVLLGVLPMGSLWSFIVMHRAEMTVVTIAAALILLVLSFFVYRPWCRHLCPIGTVLSVSNRFSLLSLGRDPEECGGCDACARSCPLGQSDFSDSNDCIRCFSCYAACRRGVLRPLVRGRPPSRRHEVA